MFFKSLKSALVGVPMYINFLYAKIIVPLSMTLIKGNISERIWFGINLIIMIFTAYVKGQNKQGTQQKAEIFSFQHDIRLIFPKLVCRNKSKERSFLNKLSLILLCSILLFILTTDFLPDICLVQL
jgi:hypothetical protein